MYNIVCDKLTKKEIAKNLISTFLEAGNISLKLREQGLKSEIKITFMD